MRGACTTRGRAWRLVGVAALVALAAGCGQEYVHFRPAESPEAASSGWIAKGTFQVPPDLRVVKVELSVRGATGENDRGVRYEALHIRFKADNEGGATFILDPAAVKVIDDEGRTRVGAEAYRGKSRLAQITLAAGEDEVYELVFDLPGGTRFEHLGSVRFVWPYRYGDKAYEAAAKFLKVDEVYYYAPYRYDPYYFYGPPYWYGPYYYDPWYPYGGPGPYGGFYGGYRHRHFR